ncbi:unnamed protein product [Paramecium octaurelia]|uniref:Uncharacterized protein n=1 Tax=Paramecium octaurelia TaxID=43137 RepID=A0A8S1VIF4_PAROT|nr:unnamed protein product [Paramecium octaurelia]
MMRSQIMPSMKFYIIKFLSERSELNKFQVFYFCYRCQKKMLKFILIIQKPKRDYSQFFRLLQSYLHRFLPFNQKLQEKGQDHSVRITIFIKILQVALALHYLDDNLGKEIGVIKMERIKIFETINIEQNYEFYIYHMMLQQNKQFVSQTKFQQKRNQFRINILLSNFSFHLMDQNKQSKIEYLIELTIFIKNGE